MPPAAQPSRGRPKSAARTPRPASEATSYAITDGLRSRMQQQRTRDTAPELAVRRLVHAMGLRCRVDATPLPGLRRRADLVFGPARVAVFIDGCLWHGCPEHDNPRAASNGWYWPAKIAGNRERDQDTDRHLAEAGWAVIRAWAHEPAAEVAARIADLVAARRPTAAPGGPE